MNFLKKLLFPLTDKRIESRYALVGTLPFKLIDDQGKEYSAVPIDISARGLGILIDPSPSLGNVLNFKDELQSFPMVVRHINRLGLATEKLSTMKRCGLESPVEIDLIEIMSSKNSLIIRE